MNQYHVFELKCTPEYHKTEVINYQGLDYGVVLSNGITPGNFSVEQGRILTDCRPGTKFYVVSADTSYEAVSVVYKNITK